MYDTSDEYIFVFTINGLWESSVSRVVLEEVDHVIRADERIIDLFNLTSWQSCHCDCFLI